MLYRLLADLVVVVHLVFILFVAGGALLAWWRPWLLLVHGPSVLWAVAGVTVGAPCPLTPLEKSLRRLGGEEAYAGGFVDHYLEGVVYPESIAPLLRMVAAVAIVAGYAGLRARLSPRPRERPTSGAGPGCGPRAPAPGVHRPG